jgi:hypothetical protein
VPLGFEIAVYVLYGRVSGRGDVATGRFQVIGFVDFFGGAW